MVKDKSKESDFQIVNHFIVGGARILSENEKEELIKKYNLTNPIDQFPKILEDDPVVIELGAKRGDIIEFNRNDFGIKYKYYRIVISEKDYYIDEFYEGALKINSPSKILNKKSGEEDE
jgi:DNA-directed RNA polymerase subunit H